ncbi:probable fatty acid methyltransferase [Phtheirospermum japonicum]|uniref:Probable fatty acid methyltransferase n=1 Tax=Phtheirospermum japonicum TaxID=374723 RepID=A0A830B6V9_9LAMI|nr:probable fatty acid methyltransferase [Phtheirospermum japonicum]
MAGSRCTPSCDSVFKTIYRHWMPNLTCRYLSKPPTHYRTLSEEEGTIYTFEGSRRTSTLKVSLRIHTPQFYWKIAKESDLGLADAYINRDFTLVDEKKGLVNLFMLFIAKQEKTPDEDLKTAQLRKINMLIDKARVSKEHHVLEIGCGWGSLAIEVVKRTGCKYTGITLSEQQLQYAELKVKEAGLQDKIKFLLCDYRKFPEGCKYDRIISCEMLEAVGHEYMEEYFQCCESALADNVHINSYDEFRLSQGFMKEYIFPGGCLPSVSRVTSAMATASRLREIVALGFDDKFIRTWEYYFHYCAAGFELRVLGNIQIVFSRPGDVAAFGYDPYTATFQLN